MSESDSDIYELEQKKFAYKLSLWQNFKFQTSIWDYKWEQEKFCHNLKTNV